MLATTSAASRNPTCTLGATAFGRPALRRKSFMASIMPGSTSAIGFILRKSARVSSRTSPSSSVSGFGRLFVLGSLIASYLSIIGFAQADDPVSRAAYAEAGHVQPSIQGGGHQIAVFAVGTSLV